VAAGKNHTFSKLELKLVPDMCQKQDRRKGTKPREGKKAQVADMIIQTESFRGGKKRKDFRRNVSGKKRKHVALPRGLGEKPEKGTWRRNIT